MLISSNNLFFTNLFRASITVKTPSSSIKQQYWLFTKKIIALTTLLTSTSQLMFYSKPTVFIHSSIFTFSCFILPKKNHFFIKHYYLKSISLIIIDFLFSFKLKIIHNSGLSMRPAQSCLCRQGMQADQFVSAIDHIGNITNFTKNRTFKSFFFSEDLKETCS